MREIAVIEAPSVLGLRPSGVQDLPAALLDAGLLEHPGMESDAAMPAVDYRLPGGLSWRELESVLATALAPASTPEGPSRRA
ncbi:hypothetical protein [Streptomyces subrutilus]|uniref:hypothetical protein n=1 Tax=Streptomyces subrutilus TaxID=36818 RepID=UPI0033CDE6F1